MNTKFNTITIETDVLVIGGGGAGCMAAIKAAEEGADVTLAEKANTRRSGQNGTGVDHIWAWVPEVHGAMGYTLEDMINDHIEGQGFGLINKELLIRTAAESYNRVMDLESYGLKFRYDDSPLPGKFRVVPQFHCVASSFNFDGRNFKPILTEQAAKRGVRIINRVMMTDLLVKDGCVAGALGVGTRTGDIYYFKAKSVIMTTGRTGRTNRNTTGTDSNLARTLCEVGDGRIMALKAGARLINMEFIEPRFLNIGPYTQSMGAPRSTTWPAGALVAQDGKTIIRKSYFTTWSKYIGPDAQKFDYTERRNKWVNAIKNWPSFMENHERGEGPFYLDCTGGNEEEISYVEWSMEHEGKGWLFVRHLDEEGIDLRKDRIEFTMNNPMNQSSASSGLLLDKNLETGVKGLFAGGDEVGGFPWASSTGAICLGWFAGDMAAGYARKQKSFLSAGDEGLESLIERCTKMTENYNGPHWKEVELALQDIVDFYKCGVTTEETLKRGAERIHDLKDNVFMKAENPHEMMRCMEVQTLLDIGELTLRASMERKESRRFPCEFNRVDYPDPDENWESTFVAIGMKDRKFEFSRLPADEI